MTELGRVATARRRAFGVVSLAAGISNLGDGIRIVAMPLLATRLTSNPVEIAVVGAGAQLPWLAAPFLGVLIDRCRPLRLMSGVDLVRFLVAAILTLLMALQLGSVALLAAASVLLGLAAVLGDSAAQVAVPALVADGKLEMGNSRLMTLQATGVFLVGPPLGAWLISVAEPLPFGVDAITFLLSGLLLLSLYGLERPRAVARASATFWSELTDGFRWVLRDRVMPRLIAVVVGLSFADGMTAGMLVLVGLRELHLSETGYGILLSAAALGGVVGPLCVGPLRRRLAAKPILVLSTVLAGSSYIAMALLLQPVVAAIALALNNAATMVWNVLTVSARQRLIPVEMLGRVTTFYRMAAWGSLPLGTLVGGALADVLGVRVVVGISGVLIVALTALVLRIPGLPLARAAAE